MSAEHGSPSHQLKPCPWCGCVDLVRFHDEWTSRYGCIKCTECRAHGPAVYLGHGEACEWDWVHVEDAWDSHWGAKGDTRTLAREVKP